MIEKKPFVISRDAQEKSKKDSGFTVRLTDENKVWFIPAKKFIDQPKNSTAMKQLAEIGAEVVLHDPKMGKILKILFGNSKRNDRLGITEEEYKVD